jgi:mono/diheme cytochrome c family protein
MPKSISPCLRRLLAILVPTSVAVLAAGCAEPRAEGSANRHDRAQRVERGKVLVGIGGCTDCHTPVRLDPSIGLPVPQMDRFLSGHPQGAPAPKSQLAAGDNAVIGPTFTSFRLPFGVVYTANLTPDPDTGLGMWTEDMFLRAMRTGRHMGGQGRPIIPPMPWTNLNTLSDDDLRAVFAYLRSIPAVRNDVPPPEVPEPALIAIARGYDKMLLAQKEEARARPR